MQLLGGRSVLRQPWHWCPSAAAPLPPYTPTPVELVRGSPVAASGSPQALVCTRRQATHSPACPLLAHTRFLTSTTRCRSCSTAAAATEQLTSGVDTHMDAAVVQDSASVAAAATSTSQQWLLADQDMLAAYDRVLSAQASPQQQQFFVVNFYHLTDIEHPGKVLREHRAWMEGRDIRGRIYLSRQGINAQYSGPEGDAVAYAQWLERHPLFQGLRWTKDPVAEHQFPKLRMKYRAALVQLAGGTAHLPLTDPAARAVPLPPARWRQMLRNALPIASTAGGGAQAQAAAGSSAAAAGSSAEAAAPPALGGSEGGAEGEGKQVVVVLDVRNGYEWDAGHFAGAQRPAEDTFSETPTEAAGEAPLPAALAAAAPDTPVMMYCTGGIRCDIYSAYLRQKGFNKLYTLEGGVANYLRQEGSELWDGSLFVFDGRMAIPPGKEAGEGLPAAAACQVCGGTAQLPHINCANIDCNRLFVACDACKVEQRGCCSKACQEAPRLLRPAKTAGYYGNWAAYASDGDARQQQALISQGRGSGRLARRRRHQERLREKGLTKRQELVARRTAAHAAMAERQQQQQDHCGATPELQQKVDRLARLEELRRRLSETHVAA